MTTKEHTPPVFFPPTRHKHRHHHLLPIEHHYHLHRHDHGHELGHLGVSYRLLKGHAGDPEQRSCAYGLGTETNEIESHFSSQDTASLELTLHNESHHSLKHVRLSNVRLVKIVDEKTIGGVCDETLPDGNLYFEIVPGDVYFGHLAPRHKEVRYLALVTRGVKPGRYAVQFDTYYDIEHCHIPVMLGLTVEPD